MTEEIAHLPSGVDLCYETFGSPRDPAVLLVMGLGGPLNWWEDSFCERLAAAGFHVIRYDNRDTGRSTGFPHRRIAARELVSTFLGRPGRPVYGMSDFADDAIRLLDHLGIERAHVVGVSMGGMIAQTIAIEHPLRLASLTSIMSTTGNRRVGWQAPQVLPRFLKPVRPGREAYIERSIANATVLESAAFGATWEAKRRRAEVTYDRGVDPTAIGRHMMAVLTQPDRTTALGSVTAPTLVIHGTKDPMVHRSGGAATARAIPGARMLWIPGMAHDLPAQLNATFVDAISRVAEKAGR